MATRSSQPPIATHLCSNHHEYHHCLLPCLILHPFSPPPPFLSSPSHPLLPVSILFPLLRRTKASTFWSSFFLSFIWSVHYIMGIPSFWANIDYSVSTYYVRSFVTGSSNVLQCLQCSHLVPFMSLTLAYHTPNKARSKG